MAVRSTAPAGLPALRSKTGVSVPPCRIQRHESHAGPVRVVPTRGSLEVLHTPSMASPPTQAGLPVSLTAATLLVVKVMPAASRASAAVTETAGDHEKPDMAIRE